MIKNSIRIIRLPNLLIMALTMYLVRHCLMEPLIRFSGAQLMLSHFHFALLVISVMLIGAGGYIINDYFDTKIDAVNKPDRVVVGRGISRQKAIVAHIALNAIAVVIGFYLAIKVGNYKFGLINLLSVGLLWFYSAEYKRKLLVGNIVIAALTAMLPWLVWIYEPNKTFTNEPFAWELIKWYSVFAFVISLIREIVKDMEDMEGDTQVNCKSLPLVAGVKVAKGLCIVLCVALLVLMGFLLTKQFVSRDWLSFCYFSIAVGLPMVYLLYALFRASNKNDYTKASMICKVIMLTGVLSMLVFYIGLLPVLKQLS